MATNDVLEQRLALAEAALLDIALGQQVVSVEKPDGTKVQFNASQGGEVRLRRYIAELKSQLGRPARRAISVGF